EVVGMGAGGLRDVDVLMHHADVGDLLAVFLFAEDGGPMSAHLSVLASEGAGRGLAAGVGIYLRIEHDHFDIHAGGQHAGQGLESDVEHGAVAADDPQPLVLPAHLVPARAHSHGVRGRVFKQRIRPADLVRSVGVGGGVDSVAAGGGYNPDVLLTVLKTGGGQH